MFNFVFKAGLSPIVVYLVCFSAGLARGGGLKRGPENGQSLLCFFPFAEFAREE